MKITLTNEFHNTETTLLVPASGKVSSRAGQRAWSKLCGVEDCICGGQLGQRGHQTHNGHQVQIEADYDAGGWQRGNRAAIVQIQDDL